MQRAAISNSNVQKSKKKLIAGKKIINFMHNDLLHVCKTFQRHLLLARHSNMYFKFIIITVHVQFRCCYCLQNVREGERNKCTNSQYNLQIIIWTLLKFNTHMTSAVRFFQFYSLLYCRCFIGVVCRRRICVSASNNFKFDKCATHAAPTVTHPNTHSHAAIVVFEWIQQKKGAIIK